jgi:integrase
MSYDELANPTELLSVLLLIGHRLGLSDRLDTRLCSDVFDAYLAHCEARLRRNDMAAATVRSYRKILDGVWGPHLGGLIFSQVSYSRLIAIADGHSWSKKTYNNTIGVLKRAFEFGYRDPPVHEKQIALVLSDIELAQGFISVNKARVSGVDRDKTNTSEDRRVQLCPRALSVLRRHLRLRESLVSTGEIDHEHVFFVETGEPLRSLQHPQRRWRKTLQSLNVGYRRPYTARQTSVSWSLMAGKNPLWVAKQHGHSIATMLRAYAAWAEGTAEVDVEAIKRSMNRGPAGD